MKKSVLLLFLLLSLVVAGCSQSTGGSVAEESTIDKVLARKKLIVGTAPGYYPFEMKDKSGNFIGYDMDLARAIAEALQVEVEFKQYEFSGLIPALQTGDIDMVLAGMTIRGDRALAVSFSDPYYATGQVVMIPKSDNTTKSWQDLDNPGKKIGVSQGTTGALLAKQIFKQAEILDFPDFPTAGTALSQGQVDGVIYDEPGVRMFEAMHQNSVKGIYDLISSENLGIAVKLNDVKTVLWLNSFLQSYRNSPAEKASFEKWFKSTDWMANVEEQK